MNIELKIDPSVNAAYIRLLSESVACSKAINDDVIVDLNEMGVVVGIEILDLDAEIPFGELTSNFHVHSETIEMLRKLRPSISGFMSLFSSDGASVSGARMGVGSRH
ncbi:MAG: DUF2283 domain-containing protein [Actinomycetota bacterium]